MTETAAMDAAVSVMSENWAWGDRDCATAACAAFAELRGFDPMAPLRGQYSTALGCARIVRPHGSMTQCAIDVLGDQGFRISERSEVGDLGLKYIRSGLFDAALVICVAPGIWAGKGYGGSMTFTKHCVGFKCPD